MPPTRRYLRLTATSAIEVRIYLDNPTDTTRWLLAPSSPALPRVLAAVRPLVLPKLREESERARGGRGKGKGKRRGVKDTVVREEFEVSVFVTEGGAGRGCGILRRRREVGGEEGVEEEEEEEEEDTRMGDIPLAAGGTSGDALFVSDAEDGDGDGDDASPPPPAKLAKRKQRKASTADDDDDDDDDDKKKLVLRTAYEGFRIYGRILCLVVKRKGVVRGKQLGGGAGQAVMEEWIGSTQVGRGEMWDE